MPAPSRYVLLLGTAALAAALNHPPAAAEPLPGNELGVLENEEVKIVQENLYEKAGHLEAGVLLGFIPNDPWVLSGTLGLTGVYHLSEAFGVELAVHAAGSRATQEAERLSEYGGTAVDSYSPRLVVDLNGQWTPIYAKLNLLGQAVVHYDIYVAAGVGAFVANRTLLNGVDLSEVDGFGSARNSPASVNIGLGHRFFFRTGDRTQAIRMEARDHIFMAENPDGSRWAKNNLHLTAGWSILF